MKCDDSLATVATSRCSFCLLYRQHREYGMTQGAHGEKREPDMILRQAVFLLIGLTLATLAVWAVAFGVVDRHAIIIGTGVLAFGLGLRHAVDPDHLAAIDNVTRKLTGEGKTPLAVGFFFALGHSAFVLIIVLLLALTTFKLGDVQMALWQTYGELFASLFSVMFLFLIGGINLKTLFEMRRNDMKLNTARPMGRIWTRFIAPLFGSITESHHMVLIGFLFALSFDTATEISLFGLTAAQGLGHSLTLLQTLIFPLLFACGMIFVDTLNGLMMLGAYRWAAFDAQRKHFYNIMITSFSVLVAFTIGSFQLFNLTSSEINGIAFAKTLIAPLADHPTTIGLTMMSIFLMIWIGAVTMMKFTRYSAATQQEG